MKTCLICDSGIQGSKYYKKYLQNEVIYYHGDYKYFLNAIKYECDLDIRLSMIQSRLEEYINIIGDKDIEVACISLQPTLERFFQFKIGNLHTLIGENTKINTTYGILCTSISKQQRIFDNVYSINSVYLSDEVQFKLDKLISRLAIGEIISDYEMVSILKIIDYEFIDKGIKHIIIGCTDLTTDFILDYFCRWYDVVNIPRFHIDYIKRKQEKYKNKT